MQIKLVLIATFMGCIACGLVYNETDTYDCYSDIVPPFENENGTQVTCQELKDMGECEQLWLLEGEYCINTCDFCGLDTVEITARSFALGDFFGYQVEEVERVPQQNRTLRGCKCPTWKHNDIIYTGCGNPNNSPIGAWCPVIEEDCPFDPYFDQEVPIEVEIEFFDGSKDMIKLGGEYSGPYHVDSCSCLPPGMCRETQGGCTCISSCNNPDHDVNGPWCEVDAMTCPPDFLPVKGDQGDVLVDYCKPGCCPF